MILNRFTPTNLDLEVRSDGRTIYGLVMPFDQEATVNDGRGPYREVFRPGSFTRTIKASPIKLKQNHDAKTLAIGRASMMREDPAGLIGEFHVADTQAGRDAIQLVHEGILDAFSIGFSPVKQETRNGLTERLDVNLREVSVVDFPAYQGATIGGVRNENNEDEPLAQELQPDVLPQGLNLADRRRWSLIKQGVLK